MSILQMQRHKKNAKSIETQRFDYIVIKFASAESGDKNPFPL